MSVTGPRRLPALVQPVREVSAAGKGVGGVGSQHSQQIGEQLLERRHGGGRVPAEPRARRRGCCGWRECQGGWVPTPAPDRRAAARMPPRRWPDPQPSPGEVAAGGQGVGVCRAPGSAHGRRAAVGSRGGRRPDPRPPPRQWARLWRAVKVSGAQGPASAADRRAAAGRRRRGPAARSAPPVGEVVAGGQGVGVCRGPGPAAGR